MGELQRFGVSMEQSLLERLDAVVRERRYASRSEALRDLVRGEIIKGEWQDPAAEVIGTITIVYDHDEYGVGQTLNTMQHSHYASVVCTTHVHLDEHNCLEVVIVRGGAAEVRHIADGLIAARGVKHGQLVCTTTGRAVE